MDKKKKQIVMTVLGLVGIVAIIASVSYAFFSYAKNGSKTNVITSGDVKFLYTEVDGVGAGIFLNGAMPMTDAQGKAQSTNYFDFRITATTGTTTSIPYTVTVKVKDGSTLDPSVIKVWLSDPVGETEIEPVRYLADTAEPSREAGTFLANYTTGPSYTAGEKVLYTGLVPAGSNNPSYTQDFRLRIWIDNDTDFTPTDTITPAHCSDSNYTTKIDCEAVTGNTWIPEVVVQDYPYNNKTLTLTVNVYANGSVASEDLTIDASEVGYYNSLSQECENDQTLQCALDELTRRLGA